MSHRLLLLANLTLALCAGQVHAQEVRLFGASEAVNPTDVARILDQSPSAEPVIKMRSLRLLDGPVASAKPSHSARDDDAVPTRVAYSTVGTASAPAPSSLALPVQFEFDSAVILPSARRQLDALAEGIRLLPPTKAVIIEGHTDAAGSAAYNEELSQRRADSVKSYLVAMQKIDPSRLHAVGFGEAGLLQGFDSLAAENRRVQFHGE